MNFADIYQRYWKNGYDLTDSGLSGIDREMFRTLFNPVAEVFRKYPAGGCHLYMFGPDPQQGLVAGNYIASAGTTQGAVDQPVGLALDGAGSVGADLCTATSIANAQTIPLLTVGPFAGRSFEVKNAPTGLSWHDGTGVYGLGGLSRQIIKLNVGATGLNLYQATGSAIDISVVEVREVTGIHATQSTPGYKPTMRRGIVNLLTYSNDLSQAIWWKSGVTLSGEKVTWTATYGRHQVYQEPSGAIVGATYTAVFMCKAAELSTVMLIADNANYSPAYASAIFDLNAGTSTSLGTIANAGNGYFLCTISATVASALTHRFSAILGNTASAVMGDGASGIFIKAGGVFAGTLTAQQILDAGGIPLTTTAPASSSAGVNYAEFDGVDDRLALGGPLFQMSDDHCVVAAIASNQVLDSRVFFAQGAIGQAARVPTLYSAGGVLTAGWRDDTGAGPNLAGGFLLPGQSCIATARKIGSSVSVRMNGVTGQSATGQTWGSATCNDATIGALPMGGANWSGRIYPLIAIKGTVSDADLLVLEKFIGKLSGVQL